MRRGDVRRAGAPAAADPGIHVQALAVGRQRHEVRASHGEGALRPGVAGFLQPNRIARVEQGPCGDLQSLLRAGDDHDLRRIASDRAGGAQIVGEGFPERRVAHRIAVIHQLRGRTSGMAGQQRGPDVGGKGVEGRQADPKCAEGRRRPELVRCRQGFLGQPGDPSWTTKSGAGGLAHGERDGLLRHRCRDTRAGAHRALEIALGVQLLEGGEDRDARHLQLRGQAPGRGNPLPRAQPPLDDRALKPVVDLPVERARAGWVQRDRQGEVGPCAGHEVL